MSIVPLDSLIFSPPTYMLQLKVATIYQALASEERFNLEEM